MKKNLAKTRKPHKKYSRTILLNAGFYVSATRYEETQEDIDGIAFYNPTTKEMRYSYTLDGGVF